MTDSPKPKQGFVARLAAMSEEERKEWYRQRREKVHLLKLHQKEEVKDWKQATLKTLANMVIEDTLKLDDPGYQPTELTLWKIHGYLNQGFSIIDVRDSLMACGACSEQGWVKLKKILFEKSLSRIEDLGFDIFQSQQNVREGILNEIRHLKRMRRSKPLDVLIPRAIIDANEKLHKVQLELTKLFGLIGVVGDKKKGGNVINFFSTVPRPKVEKPEEKEAIDISPSKVSPED